MKNIRCFFYILIAIIGVLFVKTNSNIKAQEIVYEYGNLLGYKYTEESTIFKLYSSSAVEVKIHVEGYGEKTLERNGVNDKVWETFIPGDLNGMEYYYIIKNDAGDVYENILDPYGKYINTEGTKNVVYDEGVNLEDEISIYKSGL